MTVFAHPLAATDPGGTLVARSDSHSSFGIVIVVVLVVFAILFLAGIAARRPSVVVVQPPARTAGAFLGVVSIVVVLGILVFAFLAPGSGSI